VDIPAISNTKDAIKAVVSLFAKGEHDFSRILKLVKDSEALFRLVAKIISPLVKTSQDPHDQFKRLINLETHI